MASTPSQIANNGRECAFRNRYLVKSLILPSGNLATDLGLEGKPYSWLSNAVERLEAGVIHCGHFATRDACLLVGHRS